MVSLVDDSLPLLWFCCTEKITVWSDTGLPFTSVTMAVTSTLPPGLMASGYKNSVRAAGGKPSTMVISRRCFTPLDSAVISAIPGVVPAIKGMVS